MNKDTYIYLGLIGAAFGLVLIARRPVVALPPSSAGAIAQAEAAWQQSAETADDLVTFEIETNRRLQQLELQYELQERQRDPLYMTGFDRYDPIQGS